MPMYLPPWDTDEEPNESNIKTWMDNLYGKFEPIEQARWNQSNIDTLFHAGEQRFINSYFNFYPTYNYQTFHFNLIQQPVNMVTGYQRQHRKSINYVPIENSHQRAADDMIKLVTYANNYKGILEKMSQAYEQSAITGLVFVQPFLDYTDDPINGSLDVKVWSYNSFMCDPYFREPDCSDMNFWWGQQYISKAEAINYFPEKEGLIRTMSGYGNRYGKFYFLPENYNLARNDLLVMSYIWYKSKRNKTMLYNQNDGLSYDFTGTDEELDDMLSKMDFLEPFQVQVPTWKQAVVVNEQMMYLGKNPLGFDECPVIPVMWNYDPHIAQYDLRVRSLVRAMRDSQFLMNRRIILNHEISESSINSGWKRKENSIVNEENLRFAGSGKDLIIKEGYELSDVEKIIPNAVPPSDMQLADQLADLIFKTSGVNQELMGMAHDSETGIQEILRQGAGLITLQKYFDQWDMSLKLLGKLEQKIIQNRWKISKVTRILGHEPTPEFLNRMYTKYDVIVTEGLNTAIQQQQQFAQALQLNEMLGGMLPKKWILKYATIQGKDELSKMVEEQEKQQAEVQKQAMMLEQAQADAKLQNIQASSASLIATARERHGRAESNVGLFEERLSEITQNRSLALKAKMEALEKLIQVAREFGEFETALKAQNLQELNLMQQQEEDREKVEARLLSESNNFSSNMMQNNNNKSNMNLAENDQLRSALL